MDWKWIIAAYIGIGIIKVLHACFHPNVERRPAGIRDLQNRQKVSLNGMDIVFSILLVWMPTIIFLTTGVLFWPFLRVTADE